ncbi:hypothetical protein D3C86_1915250 [compost metagenome]
MHAGGRRTALAQMASNKECLPFTISNLNHGAVHAHDGSLHLFDGANPVWH